MMPFIFGGEPPSEEQMAEMQAQAEKAEMERTAFRNEVETWVEELGPRETYLLKQFVIACMNNKKWGNRRIGELNGKMRWKQNVDPDTGHPEGKEFFADLSIDTGD